MKRGDKRYIYYKNTLETYTYLETSTIPGASKPTWLMKDNNGGRVRVTQYYGFKTPKDAYINYVRNAVASVQSLQQFIVNTQSQIDETNNQIDSVLAKIGELTN